uniref:SANT domain-containing protein n=1 Tax=Syphacia muris TaxID=451379 RepID=A0A0N5ABE4_9BILA
MRFALFKKYFFILIILERFASKKEQHERELAGKNSKSGTDDEDEKENEIRTDNIMKGLNLVDRIVLENRKRAAQSDSKSRIAKFLLSTLSGPIYQDPSDCPLVQQTIQRYSLVKPKLIKLLIHRRQVDLRAQQYQVEKYSASYAEWLGKDEKFCRSQKKLAKDEKHREIFEKTFPELKKAREERARCMRAERLGIGKRSEIVQQQEEEQEDIRRCTPAALPPMMLCSFARKHYYEDRTGIVKDALAEHKNYIENFLSSWSDDEKLTFREQIVVYGKNFAAIAEFLDRKNVKDCILYYYLSKKRQNYKGMIGKRRRKAAKYYRPPVMPRLEEIAQRAPPDAITVNVHGPKEYECCLCHSRIDAAVDPGRVLTRASYETHGVDCTHSIPSDVHICQKCRMKAIKMNSTARCQVGFCHNARRKVKAAKPMPNKWKSLSAEHKDFFMHQMLIPEDITKCCPSCHKKLAKRLEALASGELNNEVTLWQKTATIVWTSDEIETLRTTIESSMKNEVIEAKKTATGVESMPKN